MERTELQRLPRIDGSIVIVGGGVFGLTAAWELATRGWRRPTALAPTGLGVWIGTVVVGMLLRKLTAQGTAFSFLVVASVVTAILILGWRGVAAVRTRR